MKKKLMLINVTEDESRVGIIEDNTLQELLIEHQSRQQFKGNIYKGVVVQIQPSIQAAFVDFGGERNGFLPIGDVNFATYPPHNTQGRNNTIQARLKVGQTIMVQVTREPAGHKGAALSTYISLPGRFMVFMPDSNHGGVSKRIDSDDERQRLKSFLAGIESEDNSVIIRTAGEGRDLQELKKDYTMLKRQWSDIQRDFRLQDNPGVILEEDDVVIRTMRDYYTEDTSEIWVDNPNSFQKALDFMKMADPRKQRAVKLFVGTRSLFAAYGIEKQVEQLTSREVQLKSGGSIVIDPTEALVAIDVNSGRSRQESNTKDTALRTNLEAAEEVARQLRLRNLGGLIVVDFIDMDSDEHRKKVERKINEGMEIDKAQHTIGKISQFGLLELSRQRMAAGFAKTVESSCPTCNGKGRIPSLLTSANFILRQIRELAAKGNVEKIKGELPLEIANQLLNEKRDQINDLELEFGIEITLIANPTIVVVKDNSLKVTERDNTVIEAAEPSEENPQIEELSESKKPRKKRARKDKYSRSNREEAPTVEETTASEKIEEPQESEVEVDNAISEETIEKAPPEEAPKVEKKKEPRKVPAKRVKVADTESVLHSGCIFTQINELSEEDAEALTISFRQRLNGKVDVEKPVIIDDRFLWTTGEETPSAHKYVERDLINGKTQKQKDSEPTEKPVSESVVTDQASEDAVEETSEKQLEESPKKKPARRGRKSTEPTASEKDDTSEKDEKKKPAAKKASSKKPAAKKTPAKKKETAEAEAVDQEAPAKKSRGRKKKEEAVEAKVEEKPKKKAPARKNKVEANAEEDAEKAAKPAKKPAAKKSTTKKTVKKDEEKKKPTARKTTAKKTTTSSKKKEEPAEKKDS